MLNEVKIAGSKWVTLYRKMSTICRRKPYEYRKAAVTGYPLINFNSSTLSTTISLQKRNKVLIHMIPGNYGSSALAYEP